MNPWSLTFPWTSNIEHSYFVGFGPLYYGDWVEGFCIIPFSTHILNLSFGDIHPP